MNFKIPKIANDIIDEKEQNEKAVTACFDRISDRITGSKCSFCSLFQLSCILSRFFVHPISSVFRTINPITMVVASRIIVTTRTYLNVSLKFSFFSWRPINRARDGVRIATTVLTQFNEASRHLSFAVKYNLFAFLVSSSMAWSYTNNF